MSSSASAFEAYLGRRRRSADPGCEVGGVLRRRQPPPRQGSCPEQVMTAKLTGIAGKNVCSFINACLARPYGLYFQSATIFLKQKRFETKKLPSDPPFLAVSCMHNFLPPPAAPPEKCGFHVP